MRGKERARARTKSRARARARANERERNKEKREKETKEMRVQGDRDGRYAFMRLLFTVFFTCAPPPLSLSLLSF